MLQTISPPNFRFFQILSGCVIYNLGRIPNSKDNLVLIESQRSLRLNHFLIFAKNIFLTFPSTASAAKTYATTQSDVQTTPHTIKAI